jgi:hypothetical protein
MLTKMKQIIRKEYDRLREAMQKLLRPQERQQPQLILQPAKTKKVFLGTDQNKLLHLECQERWKPFV